MAEHEQPAPGENPILNGKKRAILEALKGGNTRRAACRLATIAPETLYRWMRQDVTLHDAVTRAEAEAEEAMVAAVRAQVSEDWRAAAWWLERRKPEFATRQTVTVLQQLQRDVEQLSDDDLAILAAGGEIPDREESGEGA